MDGQKSQAKLTRTNSSLLRSSPTIRSSIHSLSSVSEITPDHDEEAAGYHYQDLEEQKPHSKPGSTTSSSRVVSGSARLAPVLVLCLISMYTLFVFFNRDEIASSENLLLALIFVAVLLFFAQRNKGLIHQSISVLKHLFDEYGKKIGWSSKNQSKSVQWFIGEQPDMGTKEVQKEKNLKKCIKEGVEFYSNGDFYEGEFHKGRCNGSGVYNYFGNGRYEGDWVDGRYDGYGIESWARGSRYRGQYRNGLRHGYGVYRFYTGDSYSGEWFNGQSHGVGMQTCSDGSCYIGEFKAGVKHGLGVYHFRNGDRYAGEYFGDKIHGFGVYHFANGHCYEGSWHEGRKQGFGMYTFRNGDTKCGEWDLGNLKNPSPPLNEAVLRAVQAARRTAEKAIHFRGVDEQVNKAVMAANRAATAARVAAVKAVQNRIDGKFCDTNI
ncbi:uncharacterized protein [Coffea arabica]|uniref:Uncharacterized protein n=1 Tax=Coffea arabica TaxID=13443 RepID=A0A6P6UIE7_COFAR|nr:phosphatidylinositol 4-phosphate 5-kinase 9-like [Coffea arabica]